MTETPAYDALDAEARAAVDCITFHTRPLTVGDLAAIDALGRGSAIGAFVDLLLSRSDPPLTRPNVMAIPQPLMPAIIEKLTASIGEAMRIHAVNQRLQQPPTPRPWERTPAAASGVQTVIHLPSRADRRRQRWGR